MRAEQQKDLLKDMDWKTLGGTESSEPNVGPAVKKRLPKKIRLVPDYYFLHEDPYRTTSPFTGRVLLQVLVQGCYSKYGSTRSKRIIWEFDK